MQLRNLKKEYEDYKQSIMEKMEYSTQKEMENLNKQLTQYEAKYALNSYNFEFQPKDKKANHVF